MAAILTDKNFKCIFLNENDRIPIRIQLKFVPKCPIDNKPALVQVMALAPTRRQTVIWTNADPVHWRMYAVLGEDHVYMTAMMAIKSPCWTNGGTSGVILGGSHRMWGHQFMGAGFTKTCYRGLIYKLRSRFYQVSQ